MLTRWPFCARIFFPPGLAEIKLDRSRSMASNCSRGVDVMIVTPEQNNWSYFAKYARVESARSNVDLRLYRGGMSHLKAMLIDDQYLIAGSSNFDYLSYRLYQEILAVITAPEVISEFRERVMLPDLARSVAINCHASTVDKSWLSVQTRLLDAALTILT